MRKKRRSILKGAIIAFVAVMLSLPVMLNASDLEPSGSPAPVMRRLEEIGSWSKKLPCDVGNCPRFQVLADFNNEAVLDRETGLVWAKRPLYSMSNWGMAIGVCTSAGFGGRKGWHLPTIEQLLSLVENSENVLPIGHPFDGVVNNYFWSATTSVDDTSKAWYVRLWSEGSVRTELKFASHFTAWCVRGGQSHDAY
ncbi:MAG: DUF1566 domain-containing protein [Nitrospirae bacterium]|nr:DUF1566 domain-containing protein [Nitrospirota bacterium]